MTRKDSYPPLPEILPSGPFVSHTHWTLVETCYNTVAGCSVPGVFSTGLKESPGRRGMDSYSRWICWAVTLEKASWRADQRAPRLENTCPINWRLTNGQTCSMGFMSGEFAGQSPLLNIRTPLVRSQFLVARDVCTAAPSC